MRKSRVPAIVLLLLVLVIAPFELRAQNPAAPGPTEMPNGKIVRQIPGNPRPTNNFPTAAAVSPDGRFAVLLHSGYGAYDSERSQSISVLNLQTDMLQDFPDRRLNKAARQTYFLGLAFSRDGRHLFASMASLTDPLEKQKGSTGNGIAVYSFN
ncbi:MAG: phosphoesterase, partial [Gammaproteobacteria bacterium]|nr:phosphoesterase [Gammaproteobacteria bacterium]